MPRKKLAYVYFVSYHWEDLRNNSKGFGNMEIRRSKKIAAITDIASIERQILGKLNVKRVMGRVTYVVVLHFQLFQQAGIKRQKSVNHRV